MRKTVLLVLAMAIIPACSFAVDGVVLINKSTVDAAGGFPYVILVPGSYRLTGNLTVPAGVGGIQISASSVTLDLNGFSITGPLGTFGTSVFGIRAAFGTEAITVRNGSISGFSTPISLEGSSNLAEDLIILNPLFLSTLEFNSGVVRRVIALNFGIRVKCPAVVVESVASTYSRNLTDSTACVFSSNSGPIF